MDDARQEALTREIVAMYDRYIRAFVSDDLETINSLTKFPIAFITDGQVAMMNEYPVKPAELRAKTGWKDSVDIDVEVVGVTETKAHLVLRHCTRVRADGSPIEHIRAFYALTRAADRWKIFAVSTIQIPA
jgi:hypothetical protein